MRPNALERFLEYAAWARANPKFDLEEREHRLEIAQRMRGMLEAVLDGSLLLQTGVESAFLGHFAGRRYSLTTPEQGKWLGAWAAADDSGLTRALVVFIEGNEGLERFARFSQIVHEAEASGQIKLDPASVLAFGSLFNFAVEPELLPVMRGSHFRRLERFLDESAPDDAPQPVQYQHHVEFARRLQTSLEEKRIPIRDMVDVQSLIWLAATDYEHWAVDEPPERAPHRRAGHLAQSSSVSEEDTTPYLSICAIFRDEAPYLQEWIEFHRLVGIERFFLYDNLSTDGHREVLEPYIKAGTVALHDWPTFPAGQYSAYDHCLREHREDSRWIAFIDADEFLFSPTYRPVPDVLAELEMWPGVGVNAALFGSSGHSTKPSGLVIESYVQANLEANTYIKSIVDPKRTAHCESAHHFSYREGTAADENGYPSPGYATRSVSHARLRINHYWAKSEEELRAKCATPQAANGLFRPWPNLRELRAEFCEADGTILKYLPSLREALRG